MSTVALYSPYWSTMGGGENYVATLASCLAELDGMAVTLLSSTTSPSKADVERRFGIALDRVTWEVLPAGIGAVTERSAKADGFIYLSNFRYIPSRARRTILLLQVPYGPISFGRALSRASRGALREAAKDVLRKRLLAYAARGTVPVITNSQFVRDTLLTHFGVSSRVLHPPIRNFGPGMEPKDPMILSVGRFFRGLYNEKRYEFLTKMFRDLSGNELRGWEYHIAGAAAGDNNTRSFLRQLERENAGYPVVFHVNADHGTLRQLYQRASIFWHAAGFGCDEIAEPERAEHFGMTTVEAMSAGCIPVVVNKGGQREIVTHGVDGFLWERPDELRRWTMAAARGEVPLADIRSRARTRFNDFALPQFAARATKILTELLSV
jgi:glycosyltransferase involved in cell wall biosynthesis